MAQLLDYFVRSSVTYHHDLCDNKLFNMEASGDCEAKIQ